MSKKNAYIDELRLITIPFIEAEEELSDFILINILTKEEQRIIKWEKKSDRLRYELYLPEAIKFGFEYNLKVNNELLYDVKIGQVVRTPSFDELFFYEGELGAIYTKKKTVFKLWAPTATDVKVVLYEKNGPRTVSLVRIDKGIWEQTVLGDLNGTSYLYQVRVDKVSHEAIDPYARAVTANGEKAVVLNLEETNPAQWEQTKRPPFEQATDAIIYELHVRDFSSCKLSGIKNTGKFIGLTEKDTKGPWGTITGLDYLLDLGITHVQLLPVQDFGSVDETKPTDYNWGYDTVNYNAIEGSYSLFPNEPKARIQELKTVIQSFHQKGLRVILDVVYNHVYIHHESNFEKIVPGYYFRYNLDGSLANGTGVGNDIASERKMVRKFIIDSLLYFATEFQVDGFRFDLMGILDLETMQLARKRLSEIDPSILMIGEGWDLSTALPSEKKATLANSDELLGISHFNDQFRDKVKGNIFNYEMKGFCNGNGNLKEDLKMLVSGSIKDFHPIGGMFSDPYKSVNYVECHDNHTLWDKLEISNIHHSETTRALMHRLATAITLLSQGIPFLHAGQEFFRTKYGVENSYCSPDEINKLDWKRKALHMDNVEYVKGIIELRKQNKVFRFMTMEEVKKYMYILDTPSDCLAYMLKNNNGMFVVAFNSAEEKRELILPSSGIWKVYVEKDRAHNLPIRNFEGAKVIVEALSTLVVYHPKLN